MKEIPENVKNLSPDTSVQTLETLCNLYKFSHYHCYFLVKRVYFKADRVGGGFCRRPLTPPDMRFRIRRFS